MSPALNALMVAIGSQNAFVLRQGLRGEHLALVVVVCATSDALVIAAGVGGAGVVLERLPVLVTAVRIGGAAFLAAYGLLAAWRATRSAALLPDSTAPRSLAATVSATVALTWRNPRIRREAAAPTVHPSWLVARPGRHHCCHHDQLGCLPHPQRHLTPSPNPHWKDVPCTTSPSPTVLQNAC